MSRNGDCNGTVSNLYDRARDCQRGKGEQRNKEWGESDHGAVNKRRSEPFERPVVNVRMSSKREGQGRKNSLLYTPGCKR